MLFFYLVFNCSISYLSLIQDTQGKEHQEGGLGCKMILDCFLLLNKKSLKTLRLTTLLPTMYMLHLINLHHPHQRLSLSTG